jgi:hypothetical protein
MFNRHDLPESAKNVVKVALENDVVDALALCETISELEEKAADGKVDPAALVDLLVEYAFCARLGGFHGRDVHANVVTAAEKFWKDAAEKDADPVMEKDAAEMDAELLRVYRG